jgi:phosphotransferase system, enzyme I, PtsP
MRRRASTSIVVLIAANMVAEVCSVYVLRADHALSSIATEGLKREAVHITTMRADEGLVGLIAKTAEPLNSDRRPGAPPFSYRPETGEEIYHSFLGVPILRGGNTLGVLVVQNRAQRAYTEEEVEALETTAMVLAEMIASGELQSIAKCGRARTSPAPPRGRSRARRSPTAWGLAMSVLHEPRIVVKNIVAEDTGPRRKRLEEALQAMRAEHRRVARQGRLAPAASTEVLEAFRMFANDRGWLRRLREAVATGITAEAAVERVQSDTRARMHAPDRPLHARALHDLDDLANRLLHQLTGRRFVAAPESIPENAILVARSMGPAALLDYDRKRCAASCWRRAAPPATWPSSPARWAFPRWATWTTSPTC